MGTRRALTAVVTAAALATLAACTEDVNDGHIYVTQMYGDGCTYDEERGGIVFRFDVAGHKDADMIAEVRRSAPGADDDHPGPVVASAVHEIRGGDYENPITIVVALKKSRYDTDLTRCTLQTENYGPDVIRMDGRTSAP